MIDALIGQANALIWNHLLIYLLIGAGLWFTIATRFVQVRMIGHAFRALGHSRAEAHGGISAFQAFCIGLASRVGTGNIAGVAVAITLGGPGAVFWMWVVALVGMATAFVEATLAQLFKIPQPDGTYRGGPAYYIERGLGSRFWGGVFAVLLIVTFGLAFNAVQANTIANTLETAYDVPVWATAAGLVILAGPVVFGGMRRIARVAEWLLPVMALAYIALAVVIVAMHVDQVPAVFSLILRAAFGLDEAVAGTVGGLTAALLNGVKRGLFSNEAGMGSAPNAAATATVGHPATQGFIQALGVFVDTIVICSATAFIILVSGLYDPATTTEAVGASLTQAAVAANVGWVGAVMMTAIIFLFAFSSILGNYAYADGNLTYLGMTGPGFLTFRILALAAVAGGCLGELPTVWALADVSMGLMAIVNLVAILLLGRWAFAALSDYENGLPGNPEFNSRDNVYLPARIGTGVWRRH